MRPRERERFRFGKWTRAQKETKSAYGFEQKFKSQGEIACFRFRKLCGNNFTEFGTFPSQFSTVNAMLCFHIVTFA